MRPVIGILVAAITMPALVFVLSILPWFALGLDGVLVAGTYDTIVVYDIYAVLVAFAGALYGGWVCARIGKSWTAVIVLAALCFIGAMINAVQQQAKPIPGARPAGVSVIEAIMSRKEPTWFTFLTPCLGAIGVLMAGRRTHRMRAERVAHR